MTVERPLPAPRADRSGRLPCLDPVPHHRATNHAAFAFYSALGYRELGRVSGYYQGVEHAIRMARDVRTGRDAVPGMKQPAP